MLTVEDFDVSERLPSNSRSTESIKSVASESYMSKMNVAKRRANQQETEVFYFTESGPSVERQGRRNARARIQDSGQPIPLVVESCVRYINLYGLQQQGIFRVPGSQVEVNDIKNSFERELEQIEAIA
ncbi:hypothetical protein CRUP_003335, partial [Coryphaenoides rupestris]